MLAIILDLLHWLQPEATGGGGGGGEAAAPSGCGASQFGLIAVMMVVFYFLLIRPQQKRQREQDSMLKALRKGVKVRTSGGILGEIFDIDEREAVLIVAEKTKINVLRANIAGIEPDPSAKKDDGKKRDDDGKKRDDDDKKDDDKKDG